MDGIRQEIALADAKGDTWTAQRKSVELAKLEAQWGQTLAAVKQAEIAAERAEVEAKLAQKQAIEQKTDADQKEIAALQLKLQALGLQSQAVQVGQQVDAERQKQLELTGGQQQQNTQQTQQNTGAVQDNSAAVDGNSGALNSNKRAQENTITVAKLMNAHLNNAREAMKALSDAAAAQFEVSFLRQMEHEAQTSYSAMSALIPLLKGTGDEFSALRAKIAEAGKEEADAAQRILFGMDSVVRFFARVDEARAQTEKAYYTQKLAADQFTASLKAMTESGNINLAVLQRATLSEKTALELLNEQDLSELRSAIDDARQKMDDLRKSSEDALDAARRALLQEQDNQAELNKLDYEKTRLDLQEKLNAARNAGNQKAIADLQEALNLERQAYELKQKKLKADAESQQTSSGGNATATTSGGSGGGVSRGTRHTVILATADGKQSLTTQTDQDPQAFLDALERAKTRSLST